MRSKSKLFAWIATVMVALSTALVGFSGLGIAEGGTRDATPPEIAKTLGDNRDGTYTLSLSVTGRAESATTSNEADVIVVIDTSNSMNNHIEHETGRFGYRNGNYINLYSRSGNSYSQLTDDTYSGTVYYRVGSSYFTYTGTRYSVTRLDVAKDSVNSLAQQLLANNTGENPDRVQLSLVTFGTNASTRITGTTNLSNFQSTVNGLTTNGGTNWEEALQKANAVPTRSDAEVYVIFVSDGNPTFYLNPNGSVGGTGGESPSNVATSYNHAVDDAQAIVAAGKHFYGIGVFGSVDRMQSLVTDAGAPASNYYSATDQAALNAAFTTIINEITNALGYTDIIINDGITAMTSTALVSGEPDGFTYTRSGGDYGSGAEWDGAPQATYDGSAVSWDLGSMILENGVTYTVSFRVWPSQGAYDLVADLNNGLVNYDDLTEEQKAQIAALDGGGYGLKTNTDASLSYTQIETRTTKRQPEGFVEGQPAADGFTYTYDPATGVYTGTKETSGDPVEFDSPDPMPLTNSKMLVTKTWNDSIDPNQRPDEVTLNILRDGEDDPYAVVILNEDNNWTQEIDVAPGLIADGVTLELGHDYTIEEADPDYHFELDADPFHPMIVDGVLKKSATATGSSQATATATNNLKGRLNISKTVTHSSDTTPNPDQLFTYTIKIDESNDDDVWFSIGNSSGPIDVSGENRVTGATVDEDPKYYYAASGTEITVKIKGGENIYFLNLAAGSTYEVEEVNVPSAYTCTITNSDSGAVTSGNKTSGSIVSNTLHTVAYTNAYAVSPTTAAIPVTKVLSIPTGQTGPGDITGEFTFTLTAADGTPMPATTSYTNPDADGGTVSFGDITYTKPGTYTYTVTETGSVDGVSNDPQTSKTITVVVMDNGDGTLSATVNGANPTPTDPANTTFTNSYATTEVSVEIPVTKTLVVPSGLTGPGDITGKYTFTLAAQGGAPMPAAGGETVTNPAATGGTASFGSITYDMPGEYTYTITESGSIDGVTNDAAASSGKTVTVTVSDDGHGHLSATIKGADSPTGSSTTFTNTYGATPAKANIPVKKVLNAASGLTPPDITGAYTFTLVGVTENAPMPAQTMLTNPDANGGTVTFGEISFDRIGTYTYTVSESGTVAGVTNDSSGAKTVIITVTDDGKGTLSASVSVSADNPLTFTNTYTVTPTTATVPVTKVLYVPEGLTGPASIREAYTFTLTPQSGAPTPATTSVKNPDANGGTASFGSITFTAPGTYTYKITEAGTVAGVTNDPAATSGKTVTIEVKDNGNGTLTATVTGADGQGAGTTFTNSYAAGSITANIPVTKLLSYDSGLTPPDITGEFTFTLSADDASTPMPAQTSLTNPDAAGGIVTFGPITYNMPGIYTYTITENGSVAGITNDADAASGKTVTVVIADNGNGTLTATVTGADGQGAGTTFTNTYKVGSTTANIPVTKKLDVPEGLTGPDITEKFTFTLADWDEDETNSPLPAETELKNPDADGGTVTFGEITYDMPGTYTYIVTEAGTVAGVTNDGDAETGKTVIVVVKDNGDGTLTATVKGADGTEEEPSEDTTFTNTYGVDSTTASIPVEKVLSVPSGLTGPDDITEAYTFKLEAAAGTPMPDVTELKNPDADGGVVTFGPITFTAPGTYVYTVTEDGDVDGVANDATPAKTVTVVVVDNGNGTLTATASSTEDEPLTFTNSYSVNPTTVTITAKKLLEHADLAAGAFNFVLSAADGTPMPASPNATNAADGTVTFGEITYSAPGTFTYTIKETAGSATYFDYDGSEKTVTVVVKDNKDGTLTATVTGDGDDATFTNTYKAGSDEVFINAVKNVNGEAASLNMFEFIITADDGGALPDETTVTNNGGSVTFGPIKYDVSIFDDEPAPAPDEPETVSLTFSPDPGIEGEIMYAVPYLNGVPRDDLRAEMRRDDAGAWEPYTWTGLPNSDDAGEIAFEVYYTVDEDATPVRANGTMLQLAGELAAEPAEPAARTRVFHYTITETDGGAPGYTYDGHSETVAVIVTDNGDGTLDTEVEYAENGAVFNNAYEAFGEAQIEAAKVLNGTELVAGQFEFGLFEGDTQVGGAVTNGADGTIIFTIPYSNIDLGTHIYTVRELVGTPQTGYTYDSSSKTVIVEVTDNGDGTLSTEVEYGEGMTFTNTYKPLPTEVTLEAEKVLKGRSLVAYEFSFRITDKDGNVVSSGTNDASGKIVFSAIPITEAGTHIFTAYEMKGSGDGMTYDSAEYTFEVVVEDEGGELVVKEVMPQNGKVIFTNTYTPPAPTPDPKPEIPKTDDTTPRVAAVAILGAGLAILGMLRSRKEG